MLRRVTQRLQELQLLCDGLTRWSPNIRGCHLHSGNFKLNFKMRLTCNKLQIKIEVPLTLKRRPKSFINNGQRKGSTFKTKGKPKESMSRPEGSAAPDVFYDAAEARKYDQSSRMNTIQTEITNRAIEMLALPADRPSYILDIGCGSGLSGEVLEQHGHYWVGCDVSKDMLGVARERDSSTGDLVEHDSGLGMPFRPGSFDGIISISAIQWLCYASSKDQDPRMRLNRFFSSLYSILKRDGKAVLQFYPENPEQAVLIAQAASRVGFAGGIVTDYPNSSRAKKIYLCLSFERSYVLPQALDGTAMGVTVLQRSAASDIMGGKRRSGKPAKNKVKSKEWIMAKKARARRLGKEVKGDSKFTGRKRKDRF